MTLEKLREKFTKYEIARILGARSLQLAMDAPVLLKLTKEEEDELNFDTLKTAERELIAEVLPITIKRPLPKKSEKTVKRLSEDEIKEKLERQAEKEIREAELENKKVRGEEIEEKEVKEEGEIMEMAQPEDEEEAEEKDEGEEA
ncbi:MAG: DNA-directed RNA polymerase subunit K [Candidatus Pacearchaeota archaeon]|jgi:DNA-directed RNA polymerase subunit K